MEFRDDERHTTRDAGLEETVTKWHRVADLDVFPDGGVKTVAAGTKTVALTRFNGQYGALDGKCPHQGGPLGEGSIEDGALRCPWHGWDFDPITGAAPDDSHDPAITYAVEVREDGIYVAVAEPVAHAQTVSDLMVETMVNWGVTHVFGMVGHSNLGLADAIRSQETKGKLKYIGIRHEGAAAFACSAFAKLSGKPAACLTIAGPGATNLLTGLWDAHVDRAPVLALTGQVNTQVLGPGAFQEIDQSSAFEAVAAWSQTVLQTSNHAELMSLALKHAIIERGVAHLIFPDEVQTLPAPQGATASGPDGRLAETTITPPVQAIARACDLIAGANRPAIIVGFGARTAMDRIIALAERLGAPVLTTFKAKGQIPDQHPLAAGVLGRSGTPIASWFMNEADLLLVFGASFSDHTGIDKSKQIVQVDFDRMALGKFHPVTLPVWGEIGVTVSDLMDCLPAELDLVDSRADVAERWALWRAEKERRAKEDRGKGINSAAIFAALTRQTPEDAVIAVDVGNNTYSFGRYFECKRQSVLMSGYLGSIGFGFPAAMGAWAAQPERKVLCVSGDGGFGQYMAEFTTAVKYGMNITLVLLNNCELGKISKEQRAAEWEVWQTSLHNPDFSEYAKLCGGHGVRVTETSDLDQAIAGAIRHEVPALVEIMADVELI
ncbi:MAG: thiamine pyrophosphate-dependent enzyme [Gemmatimonadales bacterium]